ncbi:MAG: response regulator transcription factor [Lachnospiraceae bacterium]|nr:response regulator transcription factor [Lachnospiraceae bacterium]
MYIGICEDEAIQLEYLKKKIENYCKQTGEVCRLESFESAEELLFKYERSFPFDCVLLDIRMGKMDGMQLASEIRKRDRQLPIIFVTGDKDAVFDGYKVGAVRYLLKPIKEYELIEALDFVKKEFLGKENNKKANKADYFCFQYMGEYTKLDKSDIVRITVQGHYITICTTLEGVSREYTFKETMKGIREQLKDDRFALASRSELVNLQYVKSISRTECVLTTGETVAISRSCYNEFNQLFIRFYM